MISITVDSQEEAVMFQEATIKVDKETLQAEVEVMEEEDMVRTWVEDMANNREDNSLVSMGHQ